MSGKLIAGFLALSLIVGNVMPAFATENVSSNQEENIDEVETTVEDTNEENDKMEDGEIVDEIEVSEENANEENSDVIEPFAENVNEGNNQIWDGSVAESYDGGSGTATDPYQIRTPSQLAYFQQCVNGGTNYKGKYFKLTEDIFLNDITDFDSWTENNAPQNLWEGINNFAGTLDGGSHTIYGMYRKGSSDVGFFNKLYCDLKVSISNLNFDKCYVYGSSDHVGMIVGRSDYICIDTCNVNGKVYNSGGWGAGGFIGYSGSGGDMRTSITNSINSAEVVGKNYYVGGFLGYAYIGNSVGGSTSGNGNEKIILKNCINKGKIIGGNYVGGIAGRIERSMNCGGVELKYLANENEILSNGNTAGGIIGYLFGEWHTADVEECYNTSNVVSNNVAGGIVGLSASNNSTNTIKNCYNTGNIISDRKAGGILGSASGGSDVVSCHNVGDILSTDESCAFVASCDNTYLSTTKDSYYLQGTASTSTKGSSNNVSALSKEQMYDKNNYVNWDFNNIWYMKENSYPILRCFLNEDSITPDIPKIENSYIINRVKAYTSDKFINQYDQIIQSSIPDELKFQKLNELFCNYGIFDYYEGIDYARNTVDERVAFKALTDNNWYVACDFTTWLHSDKGTVARAALYSSALILNGEYKDYLKPGTYLLDQSPEVKKYKAMFYGFLEEGADKTEYKEAINYAQKCLYLLKEKKEISDDNFNEFMASLTKTSSVEQINAQMDSWWKKASSNTKLDIEVPKDSSLGKFLGITGNVLSVVSLGLDEYKLMNKLAASAEAYEKYKEFFNDIAYEDNGLPSCMKAAAAQVKYECENKANVVKVNVVKLLYDYLENKGQGDVLNAAGLGVLSGAMAMIDFSAFVVNQSIAMDVVVKKEACVEGYSLLSDYYAAKLIRDKAAFQKNPNEGNAWKFYGDYQLLYQLREEGENAYLAMCSPDNINDDLLHIIAKFAYIKKEATVKDTLEYLKKNCKFDLPKSIKVPEDKLYKQKVMAFCPVDMEIYTSDGTLVYTISDGEESDIENVHGRFVSEYRSFTDDYVKIAYLNSSDNYQIKLKGNDTGLVSVAYAKAGEEQNTAVYSTNYHKIQSNGVVEFETSSLPNDINVDLDGDGKKEETIRMQEDGKANIPVTGIQSEFQSCSLKVGEKLAIELEISPADATYKDVRWSVENPEIVSVENGKIVGINVGFTKVTATTMDGNFNSEISVEVIPEPCAHIMKHHAAKDPDCTEKGNVEYWHCSECGNNYDSEAGENIIENVDLLPLEHDFTGDYDSYDENGHWHICNRKGCDVTDTPQAHQFVDYTYNNDADYKKNGTETAVCACDGCQQTDTREKADTMMIDDKAPTGEIKVKENSWKSFINMITFGVFCKDKFDVSITAEDKETGVKCIEYYLSEIPISKTDIKNVTAWKTYASFSLNDEGKYIVYAKISDNNENITYISSDGMVIDKTLPIINGIENGKTYCSEQTFTVDEENVKSVIVNGEVVVPVDGIYTLAATNTTYTILVTDKADNLTTINAVVNSEHHYSEEWKSDKNRHWYECECGERKNEETHSLEWIVDKEAQKGVAGSKHQECTICGYKKDAVTIPANVLHEDETPNDDTDNIDNSKVSNDGMDDINNSKALAGDNSDVYLWFILVFAAGTVVIAKIIYHRKRK